MKQMPSRLCLMGGALRMRDGSDLTEYLKSRPMKDAGEVVILTREAAQQLLEDSNNYRFGLLADDERFALAA